LSTLRIFRGMFSWVAACWASLVPSFFGMPKGVLTFRAITSMPWRRISSVARMLSKPPENKLTALVLVIVGDRWFWGR